MEMQEIWKDIKNYEGLYQVSNYGKVKSFPRKGTQAKEERILKLVILIMVMKELIYVRTIKINDI